MAWRSEREGEGVNGEAPRGQGVLMDLHDALQDMVMRVANGHVLCRDTPS